MASPEFQSEKLKFLIYS